MLIFVEILIPIFFFSVAAPVFSLVVFWPIYLRHLQMLQPDEDFSQWHHDLEKKRSGLHYSMIVAFEKAIVVIDRDACVQRKPQWVKRLWYTRGKLLSAKAGRSRLSAKHKTSVSLYEGQRDTLKLAWWGLERALWRSFCPTGRCGSNFLTNDMHVEESRWERCMSVHI